MGDYKSSEDKYINTRDKKDYRLSIIICWMMISLFVINSAYLLESLTGIPSSLVSNGAKAVLLILIVINIWQIIKGVKSRLVLCAFFGAFLILLNALFAGDNNFFISTVKNFILNVFPVFVVVACLDNNEILLKMLKRFSSVLILLSVLVLLFARGSSGSYSMGFANSLTLPMILAIHDYYLTKKWYKLAITLMGCVIIIALGSRGSLLGIGLYAIVMLARGLFTKEHRARSAFLIVIISLGLIFYKNIVYIAISMLDKINIHSRTLYLLLYDQSHDSGRGLIYQSMINEIQKHPFRMHGIAGEYAITNGFYAHNFILELLINFGIIFGGIALIFILFQIIKTIYGSVFSKDPDIYMIFMSASIPVMLVSGSLWTTTYFWLWIALIINRKNMIIKGL